MSEKDNQQVIRELRAQLAEESEKRRAAEEALLRERSMIERLLEQEHYGIFVSDGDGMLLRCNDAFLAMKKGKPGGSIFDGPNFAREDKLDRVQKLKDGETVYIPEVWIYPEDGTGAGKDGASCARCTIIPLMNKAGKLDRIVGLMEDITEQHRDRISLRQSEEKYRGLVDATRTGYLILDEEGRVVDANEEYLRLSGHKTMKEIMGRTVVEWTAPHDRERNAAEVKKCQEHGFVNNLEVDYVDRKGKITPIEVNAVVLRLEEGVRILSLCRDISERKLAEETLRASEKNYRTIVESVTDIIFTMDLGGNYLFVNPAFEAIHGYTEEEALAINAFDLFHPDDVKNVYDRLEGLNKGQASANFEHRYRGKDGSYRNMLTSGQVIQDSDGNVLGVLGISRDITDLKNAEEKLSASEEKYKTLVETVEEVIFRLDLEGNLVFINSAYERLHGYTAEEAAELNGFDPIHPDDRERIANNYKLLRQGKKLENVEYRYRSKNGGYKYMLGGAVPIFDEAGNVTGSFGSARDITGLKQAEIDLLKSEEQFRLAFENATDAIFWADAETGNIINCNSGAEKLLGMDRTEIIGIHQTKLHPPEKTEKYLKMFREHVSADGALEAEAEVLTKSGNHIPVYISSSVTRIGGKQVNQGIFRDIRIIKTAQEEKEQLQRQLLQAQKMEAIGSLAGGMAHDFNNSLSVILGNSEIAMRRLKTGDSVAKYLNKIISASERARELTMKLLTFARKDILNVRVVSVDRILQELVDILKRSIPKKIKIKQNFGQEPYNVSVDVNQVLQALVNICINACDAMPAGGTLSIVTKDISSPQSVAPYARPDSGVFQVIEIMDNGHGIPEKILDRIFDPFYTTKEIGKGTGLGLSIAAGIIKNHGGKIDVESTPGEGTVFRIFLPATSAPEDAWQTGETRDGKGNREKILIIDDDPDFSDMAAEAIELAGYEPVSALSARDAVEFFSGNSNGIDLVLLDIQMPDMDGADVFNELRKLDPDVKVVLCSGYSLDGKASELLDMGAKAFLQKPFSSQQLQDTLKDALK